MIPKWYPNKEDPQFGVFIQKHAKAIAIENKVVVIFAYSDEMQKEYYSSSVNQQNNLLELIITYKKNKGIFSSIVNGWRYFNAIQIGYSQTKSFFEKPDIIHSYILLRTAIIARFLSWKLKTPYVISEQWSGYATGKYSDRSFVQKKLTKCLIKNAAGLTSVSTFLKNKMHDCGLQNKNEIIIPNLIERQIEIKAKVGSTINILLVADLVDDIKNISSVIKAVAVAIKTHPNFILRIIGHGRDKEILLETARELGVLNNHVIFEGLKTNLEVYEYLTQCDFLVMNSRFETFSLICCEALSCGKPVLATRCGGPQEFITDEVGILIDVDDDKSLLKKFIFMLENYKLFDSHKIMSSVEKRFSQKRIKELFDDFYFGILNGKE